MLSFYHCTPNEICSTELLDLFSIKTKPWRTTGSTWTRCDKLARAADGHKTLVFTYLSPSQWYSSGSPKGKGFLAACLSGELWKGKQKESNLSPTSFSPSPVDSGSMINSLKTTIKGCIRNGEQNATGIWYLKSGWRSEWMNGCDSEMSHLRL